MSTRKRNIWIACALLFTVIAISQSLAFLTTNVDTENKITFGNLDLKIRETTLNENGEEIAYSPDETENISKKSTQSRIVRVENTGRQPMYVRVALDLTGTDSDGGKINDDVDALAQYNLNEEDWIYQNGWYYYKDILEPGSKTEELMTEVVFDINTMSSRYPGGVFDLDIKGQGVQSKNNEAEDVLAVKGWPEE